MVEEEEKAEEEWHRRREKFQPSENKNKNRKLVNDVIDCRMLNSANNDMDIVVDETVSP